MFARICTTLLLASIALGCSGKTAEMEPFKCEIELIVEGDTYPFTTFFFENFAVEFDPIEEQNVAAVYDLEAMTWTSVEPSRTVSLEECESWSFASAERSRRSLVNSTDKNLNRFVELTIEPKFAISDDKGDVTLKNDVLTYRITNPISLDGIKLKRFFAYDRLNAYRKAMTDQKMPPFSQLAVDAELERRGIAPGTIDLEISTPTSKLKMQVKLQFAKITESEKTRVQNAIREATGTE